jgi:cytochrome bd-type quinol oxidase subunit 2
MIPQLFRAAWSILMMPRFFMTVLVGGLLHGVACIIKPPFEFGKDRPTEFFFATISGVLFTSFLVVALFLPLRAALRRSMPRRAPRIHAIMIAGVMVVVVTALTIGLVLAHHTFPRGGNYQIWWTFWSIYVVACVLTFFWPRADRQDGDRLIT